MSPLIPATPQAYADVFGGRLFIPGTEKQPERDRLTVLIQETQDELLPNLLGYGFYKTFSEALLVDPVEDRWTALQTGTDWVDEDGISIYWGGLARIIACHAYYRWHLGYLSETTLSGESRAKSKERDNVNPKYKMVDAWNEAAAIASRLWYMLENHRTDGELTYPEYDADYVESIAFNRMNTVGIWAS